MSSATAASTAAAFRRLASTSSAGGAQGKHKVLVIGGGSGGLAAANQIYNAYKSRGTTLAPGDVAIVDANQYHDYQPGWTVVGSGLANKESFRRPLDSLIPSHIAHIVAKATAFQPENNKVVLSDGQTVGYDYLVVAAGLQLNVDKVKNLSSALQDPLRTKVSTIYKYDTADKTWDLIQKFDGKGQAIFTQPFGVIKCAGAPQKIAYMADSFWKSRSSPVPSSAFITGMPTMFSVPHYSKALNAIRQEKGIAGEFNTNLTSIDVDRKVATFEVVAGDRKGEKVEKEYGMLHVTPPMGPLDVIKSSPLADGAGWVDVDQGSLQHKKYKNVFSLGDASSLPTSKVIRFSGVAYAQTAAAITAQTPVLVHNLITHAESGKVGEAKYDGYTSCPLFTGRGELLLAEFKYGLERKETFGQLIDQSKPNRAFYHITKDILPRAYFSQMVTGNWYGPNTIFPPQFASS